MQLGLKCLQVSARQVSVQTESKEKVSFNALRLTPEKEGIEPMFLATTLTTETVQDLTTIVRLYSWRWGIETFFWMFKQASRAPSRPGIGMLAYVRGVKSGGESRSWRNGLSRGLRGALEHVPALGAARLILIVAAFRPADNRSMRPLNRPRLSIFVAAALLLALAAPGILSAEEFRAKDGAFTVELGEGWTRSKSHDKSVVLVAKKGRALLRISRLPRHLKSKDLLDRANKDLGSRAEDAILIGHGGRPVRSIGKGGRLMKLIEYRKGGEHYRIGYFSLGTRSYALLLQNGSPADFAGVRAIFIAPRNPSSRTAQKRASVDPRPKEYYRTKDGLEFFMPPGFEPLLDGGRMLIGARHRPANAKIKIEHYSLPMGASKGLERAGEALQRSKRAKENDGAQCSIKLTGRIKLKNGWEAAQGELVCKAKSGRLSLFSCIAFVVRGEGYFATGRFLGLRELGELIGQGRVVAGPKKTPSPETWLLPPWPWLLSSCFATDQAGIGSPCESADCFQFRQRICAICTPG